LVILSAGAYYAAFEQVFSEAVKRDELRPLVYCSLTDNEVMAAILDASRHDSRPGHDPARRIVHREHFRTLYQRNPSDIAVNPDAAKAIAEAASCKFDRSCQNARSRLNTDRPAGTNVQNSLQA